MSCSVAIASSPVFSPSRVSLSCKGSLETTLNLALPDGSPASAPSSPSCRPVFTGTIFSSRCGGSFLKRKRPDRISIPLPAMELVDLLGTDERKELEEENEGFAVYCKKGKKRLEMEDRYVAKLGLCNDSKSAFFGVFDGHSGKEAAEFTSQKIGDLIQDEISKNESNDIKQSIKNGYLKTDEQFLNQNIGGGVCCVTALIKNGDLFVSNAGDCRAVLSKEGKALALTSDHKPCREDEKSRIENLGGFVHYCHGTWRVQGSLAVSRGIGDSHLKEWIISEPETQVLEINPGFEFLILGSDGLWDKISNQEAVDLVREFCVLNPDKSAVLSACKKLAELAALRGSSDDISVMIIQLQDFI